MASKARTNKIRLPGLIASPEPYRLIKWSEIDTWEPTIEDINNESYDYVRLHRFVGLLDIGLPDGHKLAVTFDGSFILPPIPEFLNLTSCVEVFNGFFGRLLLGGIYTKAIDATYIQRCLVQADHYYRTHGEALNPYVRLKDQLRSKHAGPLDSIVLFESNFITMSELTQAFNIGDKYFKKIKNLTPSIICKGVSSYINNSYSESLIYHWLSIEQLIDFIWGEIVLTTTKSPSISGRKAFLEDNRSWPVSTKIEMFYQKGYITSDLYTQLSTIRKARNKFVHTGNMPSKDEAKTAYRTTFELLSLVVTDFKDSNTFNLLLSKYESLDPIQREFYDKREATPIKDVRYWYNRKFPLIPGDDGWDTSKYRYDVGFEFYTRNNKT